LLAAVHFAAFVDRALPSVIAPLLKADLDLSDAAIGALQGPAFISLYLIGLLLAGHLVSRTNPWKVAAACVCCWTLGGVVFALAPGFEGLTLGRVLLGAGQAAFAPAALMLLGAQADPTRRSKMISMFTAGSATGRSGALLVGGGLLVGLSGGAVALGLPPWRALCLVLTAPNLLLALGLFGAGRHAVFVRDGDRHGLGEAVAAIRRRPAAFLGLAACGAGCILLVQAAGAWAPSILNRAYGLTPAEAALAFGGIVLVFAPTGHLAAGWLGGGAEGRRLGPGPILAVASLVAVAGACGFALTSERVAGLAFLCVLTASGGTAAAITLVTLQEMTETTVKPAMGALFLAVTSLVGVGGGPWLTGLLSDSLSVDGHALAGSLAMVIAPAGVFVAIVALASRRAWRRGAAT
jgi:MFS family permease